MKRWHWIVPGAAALLLSVTLPVFAQQTAAGRGENREQELAKMMQTHGMTLSKAVQAAETQTGGTAISAQAKRDDKSFIVRVDCVVADKVVHATVDEAGKVKQTDKAEHSSHEKREKKDKKGSGTTNP